MSLLLLFPSHGPKTYLKHYRIPLIVGNIYKLSFKVRGDLQELVTVLMTDSTQANISLSDSFEVTQNQWKSPAFEFTALATDTNSYLIFIIPGDVQNIYFDNFKLINLTRERKQYRIMRIQGSMTPGSFIQTLTLREKTTAETA